jgi:hypothetical protein
MGQTLAIQTPNIGQNTSPNIETPQEDNVPSQEMTKCEDFLVISSELTAKPEQPPNAEPASDPASPPPALPAPQAGLSVYASSGHKQSSRRMRKRVQQRSRKHKK